MELQPGSRSHPWAPGGGAAPSQVGQGRVGAVPTAPCQPGDAFAGALVQREIRPFPQGTWEAGRGYSLVMPSVMMSVILQQDESMRMLSWSTTSTWGQVSAL